MREVSPKQAKVVLGLSDLDSSKRDSDFVSDDIFLATLAVVYHELWHVRQLDLFYSSDDKSLSNMLLSKIASIGNDDFYKRNHALFSFEADANVHGLAGVEGYLYKRFPNVDCGVIDKVIVDRYKNGSLLSDVTGWISLEELAALKSLDDVYVNCRSMIEHAKSFRKQIAIDENGLFVRENGRMDRNAEANALSESKDEFAIAIGQENTGYDWAPVVNRYLNETTGSGVDRMLACMHLYLYPETRQGVPVLRRLDMSPERIFGMKFPEPASSIIRRIKEEEGGMYRKSPYVSSIGYVPFSREFLELDVPFQRYRDTSDLDKAYDGIMLSDTSACCDDYSL